MDIKSEPMEVDDDDGGGHPVSTPPAVADVWPLMEREQLLSAVAKCFKQHSVLDWDFISQEFETRSADQLQQYYQVNLASHMDAVVPVHVLEDLPTPGNSSSLADNSLDADFVTPKRFKSEVKLEGESLLAQQEHTEVKQEVKQEGASEHQELKRRRTADVPPASPAVTSIPPEFLVVPESDRTADKRRGRLRQIDAAAVIVRSTPSSSPVRRSALCFVCGSPDDSDRMLTCSDCCESFHTFCLEPARLLCDAQYADQWTCARCVSCSACGLTSERHRMLVCSACDRGFHTGCLAEPLAFVPFGDWRCEAHARCPSCHATTPGDQRLVEWHGEHCAQCAEYIAGGHQCPLCLAAYNPMSYDVKMLCCELCETWAHLECIGLSEASYEQINALAESPEASSRDVAYHCHACVERVHQPRVISMLVLSWDGTSHACHSEAQFVSSLEALRTGQLPAQWAPADVPPAGVAGDAVALAPRASTSSAIAAEIACCLCGSASALDLGRLLPAPYVPDTWVHAGCLLWSKGARLGGPQGNTLVTAHQVFAEARRLNTRCSQCGQGPPPLLQCRHVSRCANWVHLACCRPPLAPIVLGLGKAMCAEHAEAPEVSPGIQWSQIESFCARALRIPDPETAAPEPPPLSTFRTWQDNLQELIDRHPNSVLTQQFVTEKEHDVHIESVMGVTSAPRNEFRVGALTVASLGTINWHPMWHTAHLIFPEHYSAARLYDSYVRPGSRALFLCSIVARSRCDAPLLPLSEEEVIARAAKILPEDDEPVFMVRALDDPGTVFASVSPLVWRHVLARYQGGKLKMRDQEDLLFLFGLSPAVMRLLETCENANMCPEYEFAHWELTKHRTAVKRHPYGCVGLMPVVARPSKKDNDHRFVYSTLNGDDLVDSSILVRKRSEYERETPDFALWKKLMQYPPSIVVHKSRIHGMGVFSLKPIQQGDMVIEYQGEIIRHSVADKREREYEEAGIPCYLWRLTDKQIVDATFKGNMARFINHCCQPNCEVRIVEIQGTPKVVVFTKRDILAGEELSYDYMFELEDEKIPCFCGARRCKGFMN